MSEFIPNPFEMIILNSPPKFLNEILKKQKKRIQGKRWRFENRDKEKERGKKWRLENPDKEKERGRKYRSKNVEKTRERKRKYRLNNREKCNEYQRKLRARNPEKTIKQIRKNGWKRGGLNMDNFEEIYERYLSTTHCDLCGVELTKDKVNTKTTRCMDHSHITGEFRNIVCLCCNFSLPHHT